MSRKPNLFKRYRLVWLVVFLGALYYIFDSFIDSYLLDEGRFADQLLSPEPLELWWRLSISLILLLFGIYAQILINRAEDASKQAHMVESFLHSIIDNTPLMVFIKDAQYLRFVKVNKEAENLMGFSREELIGKNDFDFFPEEQAKFFTDTDKQVLRNKIPSDIDKEDIDTKNIGLRTLHTRKVPILDDNGDAVYLLGISEDITEQIKAQNELIAEKSRAELYLQISEAIIVGLDKNERITLINRRGCEILKRSEEELIGQNWFEIAIPEHERDNVCGIYKKVMASEIELAEYYENEIVSADGILYYISWHNTIQKSLNGEIEGVLSSGIDNTSRKAMENQLRLAGAVYESTNQGVVVTDKNNRIVSVNPAYSTITGYASGEVIGKDPSHLKSGHHDESFYQTLWGEIEQSRHWKGEILDRRKNGEVFPSWQSISSIVNDSGELTHYVSVFSDITPIKQHQESLKFLAHHDPLTGLPNRLMLNDRIDHALQRCERNSTQLALMFLDLDDFKYINDTYGHDAGDQVLQIIAKRLELLVRKEDTVARLGGDEFLVLLESDVTKADINQIANKIINEATLPINVDGQELSIGISIGISTGPAKGQNYQSLISTADRAMYRAKKNGRNTYSF
ncbi:MAG: diguanylate cyclase [Desulfuromusa sp.]|nr:diguanylate cyclase [Desulfuromusa sp.]